jgi:hypothetical protein
MPRRVPKIIAIAVIEKIARYGDLGHLERDVAAMASQPSR